MSKVFSFALCVCSALISSCGIEERPQKVGKTHQLELHEPFGSFLHPINKDAEPAIFIPDLSDRGKWPDTRYIKRAWTSDTIFIAETFVLRRMKNHTLEDRLYYVFDLQTNSVTKGATLKPLLEPYGLDEKKVDASLSLVNITLVDFRKRRNVLRDK